VAVETIEALDPVHAASLLAAMAAKGMEQVGRPLAVSIAGRSVSYGSAAEAFLAMSQFIKSQRELAELAVTLNPWTVDEVIRG